MGVNRTIEEWSREELIKAYTNNKSVIGEDNQLITPEQQCEGVSNEELIDKLKYRAKLNTFAVLRNNITQLLLLKDRRGASELIVKYLEENYIFKALKEDDQQEIWVYIEGIYLPNGKSVIEEVTRDIMQEIYTQTFCNEVIYKIKADSFIDKYVFFNKQNEYPYLLPVQNGLLDLKTRILHPFREDIYFFAKINAVFEVSNSLTCENSKFVTFLKSIFANEKDILTIQEVLGYCLMKEYRFHNAFMFYGKGRNGKGVLLDFIDSFLGSDNVSNISLKQIDSDKFALIELHNKLANIGGDLDSGTLERSNMFKSATGQDMLRADRKFQTSINFVNYATLIFACNELPVSKDSSLGFWDRWVKIDFPFTFLKKQEYDSLSHLEKREGLVRVRDEELKTKLKTDFEFSFVLNWALDGLDRLLTNNSFTISVSAEKTMRDWMRNANSFKAFVDDCVVEGEFDSYITTVELNQQYAYYCKLHKSKVMSANSFFEILNRQFGAQRGRRLVEGVRFSTWEGIKFKDSFKKFER